MQERGVMMDGRQRKIFSGDPACVGIILLVVLWLVTLLAAPPLPPVTETESIAIMYRGR